MLLPFLIDNETGKINPNFLPHIKQVVAKNLRKSQCILSRYTDSILINDISPKRIRSRIACNKDNKFDNKPQNDALDQRGLFGNPDLSKQFKNATTTENAEPTTETNCEMIRNKFLKYLQKLLSPSEKTVVFWKWLTKKISITLKKVYNNVKNKFIFDSPKDVDTQHPLKNDILELALAMRLENERLLSFIDDKFSSVMNEMEQMKVAHQNGLVELQSEMESIKNSNTKLIGNNQFLTQNIEKLLLAVENGQSNTEMIPLTTQLNKPNLVMLELSTPPPPPPMPKMFAPPPPPPMPKMFAAPPPPPMPPVSLFEKRSNFAKQSPQTLSRKGLIPRPDCPTPITPEDLRKVTLKKVSKHANEQQRQSSTLRATISVEMLRSVKLKPIERKISDSPVCIQPNNTHVGSSLAPMPAKAENSPLRQMRKQVVNNGRNSMGTFLSPR